MMFITPMPPRAQRHDRSSDTQPKEQRHHAENLGELFGMPSIVSQMKSASLHRADRNGVTRAMVRRTCSTAASCSSGSGRLQIRVSSRYPRSDAPAPGFSGGGKSRRDRGIRSEKIIVVRTVVVGILAFFFQNSDDEVGNALYKNGRAGWRAVRGRADGRLLIRAQRTRRPFLFIVGSQQASFRKFSTERNS